VQVPAVVNSAPTDDTLVRYGPTEPVRVSGPPAVVPAVLPSTNVGAVTVMLSAERLWPAISAPDVLPA
jgi:hypothetical protein